MSCTAPKKGHHRASAEARCPVHRSGVPSPVLSPAGSPSLFRAHAEQALRKIFPLLADAGFDTATDKLAGALLKVAVEIQSSEDWRGNSSHCLCKVFADAAEAIDPGEVASAVGDFFEATLIKHGVPGWAAIIAGRGIAEATKRTLSTLEPAAQLSLGVRIVAIWLCPQPERCPEGTRLSAPLFEAALDSQSSAS